MKSRFIFCLALIVFTAGCENQSVPTSALPHIIPVAKLVTPQQDGKNERSVQISYYPSQFGYPPYDLRNTIYYTAAGGLYFQYLIDGFNERHLLIPDDWSEITRDEMGADFRLSPNEQYIIYLHYIDPDGHILKRFDLVTKNNYIITSTTGVFNYCISPDSEHIAYFAYYGYPPDIIWGIFITPPESDNDKVLITESASAAPICWLSNNELIVRKNHGAGCDIVKYDINNPGQPGQLLYTVEDAENYPLGYSETINVNEGWYIDSFYAYPDIQWGKNLYKCPVGVSGDYGEQLTEGGNNDYPGNLAADGHIFVFSREYRDDYEFLTGHRDIYLMDLNQIQ
jgi:hypothetical protein